MNRGRLKWSRHVSHGQAIYAIARQMSSSRLSCLSFMAGSLGRMPWLPPMGFRFSLLFAAPLLLAAPALAQQDNGAEPVFNLPRTPAQPRTDPNAQGPELDVFRGAPTPATPPPVVAPTIQRSEEHTSELQSLMRISYAV